MGSGKIITDAERTKLDEIEESADVTDASNVLSAGAVMINGDQNIDGVKTFSKSTILNSTLSVGGNSIFTGNVGIGTTNLGESNFCIQSTGYTHIINNQHKTQLSIENSANTTTAYNSSMGIGVMDDGKGTIQVKKVNEPTGYKDLLLQSLGGNVGIGTNNANKKLHVQGDSNINNIELKKWNNSNVDREIHGPTSGNFLIRSNSDKALYLGGQDIHFNATNKTVVTGNGRSLALRDPSRYTIDTDSNSDTFEKIIVDNNGNIEGHVYLEFETKNVTGRNGPGTSMHTLNQITRKGYIGIPGNDTKKLSIVNEFADANGLIDLQEGGLVVKCDANKNVGIGTTNPTSRLHVKQTNSATDCILTIEAERGTNLGIPETGIEFKSNDGIKQGPNNPNPDGEITYTSSKILSGWKSGEDDYNQSFFKVQTYHTHSSSAPLPDLKDTLVIKGPNVGIGITNPTQKLEVDGWIKSNSSLNYYEIDFSTLSVDQFAPVILEYGIGNHLTSEIDFYIQTPNGIGGEYPNNSFIKGTALGGGWSDSGSHINVEYYSWDRNEWSMLGIYKGNESFAGITIYLRGGYKPSGHTPLNGSNGSNISNAGKYKIYTRAKYCEGFINGTLKYESYFPIMEYRKTDSTDSYPPNGTVKNVSQRIYNTKTNNNESAVTPLSKSFDYSDTTSTLNETIPAKNYDTDGWTFSFRFKLKDGELDTTGKHIGIIQLTHDTNVSSMNKGTLREISFSIAYNNIGGGTSKYVFYLGGAIELKINGGDYPDIADNTWYHVVITKQNSTTNPIIYINNEVYVSHYSDRQTRLSLSDNSERTLSYGYFHTQRTNPNLSDSNFEKMKGYLEKVYFFNKFVTISEVNTIYGDYGEFKSRTDYDNYLVHHKRDERRSLIFNGPHNLRTRYFSLGSRINSNQNAVFKFAGDLYVSNYAYSSDNENQIRIENKDGNWAMGVGNFITSGTNRSSDGAFYIRNYNNSDSILGGNDPTKDSVCFMIEKNNGNVGIGTTNPGTKLHVVGDSNINGVQILDNGNTTYKRLQMIGGNSFGYMYGAFNNALGDGIHLGYNAYRPDGPSSNNSNGYIIPGIGGGTSRLSMTYNHIGFFTGRPGRAEQGTVGDPNYKQEIHNPGPTHPILYMANNKNHDGGGTTNVGVNTKDPLSSVSLDVNGKLRCTTPVVSSDERIKTEIESVPDQLALNQVRALECKYYHYKDPERRRTQKTIGFIAQDVDKIIPNAVTKDEDEIPDILETPSNIKWIQESEESYIVELTLTKILSVGTKVKLQCDKFNNIYNYTERAEVISSTDTTCSFKLTKKYNDIFVYGTIVDDFHTIDKNQIFALHHTAIQELDKTIESEKQKTAELESKVTELQNENSQLKSQMETILQRLAALENKN